MNTLKQMTKFTTIGTLVFATVLSTEIQWDLSPRKHQINLFQLNGLKLKQLVVNDEVPELSSSDFVPVKVKRKEKLARPGFEL